MLLTQADWSVKGLQDTLPHLLQTTQQTLKRLDAALGDDWNGSSCDSRCCRRKEFCYNRIPKIVSFVSAPSIQSTMKAFRREKCLNLSHERPLWNLKSTAQEFLSASFTPSSTRGLRAASFMLLLASLLDFLFLVLFVCLYRQTQPTPLFRGLLNLLWVLIKPIDELAPRAWALSVCVVTTWTLKHGCSHCHGFLDFTLIWSQNI